MTLVGVVGHPISHSLSPAIHNAALRHDGRDAVYEAFDVEPGDLRAFVEDFRARDGRGLNVTVPHKGAAYALAQRPSPEAEATRAVNTLVFAESVEGHNTDVAGLGRALDDLGVGEGVRALVIGAGGAGRAALEALRHRAGRVRLANRTASRAEEAARAAGAEVVAWEDLPAAARQADLVVQATTVGLGPGEAVLSPDALKAASDAGCRWLLDVVYSPGETELVRTARRAGIAAADGLSMLVHQAAEAYRLFWGAEAPLEVMERAARRAAGRT